MCTILGVTEMANWPWCLFSPYSAFLDGVTAAQNNSLSPYLSGNKIWPHDLTSVQWHVKGMCQSPENNCIYQVGGTVMLSSFPLSSFLLAGAAASLDNEEEITYYRRQRQDRGAWTHGVPSHLWAVSLQSIHERGITSVLLRPLLFGPFCHTGLTNPNWST